MLLIPNDEFGEDGEVTAKIERAIFQFVKLGYAPGYLVNPEEEETEDGYTKLHFTAQNDTKTKLAFEEFCDNPWGF